jgi:hypothetical protein
MVLGFMAAFVIGDWIVGNVRPPRHYTGRNIVREKLALYESEKQTPDVVFLGTSHEWCGIDPVTVDEIAFETSGTPMQSLNLATSAASTITSYLLARRIVESDHHPRLVYLGVSPAVSDANETDTMLNGLRALGEFRDLPLAWSCESGLFWDTLTTSLLGSYYQWDDIRTFARRVAMGAPTSPKSKMQHTDRGWARWPDSASELPRLSPPVIDDETLSQMASGFSRRGPLAEALEDTVTLLKSAGIDVRLLEIPVTTIAAPWSRPETNPTYRAMVERIARVTNTTIIRVPEGVLTNGDFFDPVHLHAQGARKLSTWLAMDVASALENCTGSPTQSAARD